jgi:hypothetical protein
MRSWKIRAAKVIFHNSIRKKEGYKMNNKKIHVKTVILPFISLIMVLLSTSCAVNTGTFGVGNPTALPPKQSLESLKNYADYLQKRMSLKIKDSGIEQLDPLTTNRTTHIEYAKAFKGQIKVAPPGAAAPPSVPDNSKDSILPAATDVTETTDKPSGLLMDKISTLEAFAAHKQRIFDLSCLYSHPQGFKLYKVFFTLWVEPERQDLWTYLWRWADYNGFRNYTKDYHADIKFNIFTRGVKVVRLEPEHEGSISDEYYTLMNQSELGISAAWQDVAAKGDLAERLRQAEVEQRKYPILRSVIESSGAETDFHYIVSPRQHVEERAFRIPLLMSPYAIKRRIESVPYNVSAYFLVPTKTQTLNLKVSACYKEYGKPEKNCPDNPITDDSGKNKKEIKLAINLPSTSTNPRIDSDSNADCSVSSPPENSNQPGNAGGK